MVDLCSGSGAIAGAVATERPDSTVHAVELSPEACVWARRNLAGTGATLHEGDIDGCLPELNGQVDAVISNPPYIPLTAWESVTAEVRDHDPALALWSGDDGLDEIKVVAATAGRLLKPGGWFGCEHADVQGESAPAVFTATGLFTEVRDQLGPGRPPPLHHRPPNLIPPGVGSGSGRCPMVSATRAARPDGSGRGDAPCVPAGAVVSRRRPSTRHQPLTCEEMWT